MKFLRNFIFDIIGLILIILAIVLLLGTLLYNTKEIARYKNQYTEINTAFNSYLILEEAKKETTLMLLAALGLLSDMQNQAVSFSDIDILSKKRDTVLYYLDELANIYDVDRKLKILEINQSFDNKTRLVISKIQSLLKFDPSLKIENVRKNLYYDFKELLDAMQKVSSPLKSSMQPTLQESAIALQNLYNVQFICLSVFGFLVVLLILTLRQIYKIWNTNFNDLLYFIDNDSEDVSLTSNYKWHKSLLLGIAMLKLRHKAVSKVMTQSDTGMIVCDANNIVISINEAAISALSAMGFNETYLTIINHNIKDILFANEELWNAFLNHTDIAIKALDSYFGVSCSVLEFNNLLYRVLIIESKTKQVQMLQEFESTMLFEIQNSLALLEKTSIQASKIYDLSEQEGNTLGIVNAIFASAIIEMQSISDFIAELSNLLCELSENANYVTNRNAFEGSAELLAKVVLDLEKSSLGLNDISDKLLVLSNQVHLLTCHINIEAAKNGGPLLFVSDSLKILDSEAQAIVDSSFANIIDAKHTNAKDVNTLTTIGASIADIQQNTNKLATEIEHKAELASSIFKSIDKSSFKLKAVVEQLKGLHANSSDYCQAIKALSSNFDILHKSMMVLNQKSIQHKEILGSILQLK